MSSVAARVTPLHRTRMRLRSVALPVAVLGLVGLTALSLLLRTRALLAGFWIDEGLSVGIASHPLADIPSVLRLDGSPPLYYLLLHVWMQVFGSGEGETHGMSVGFAVLSVPVAFWAARSLAGQRAGWLAAAVAAIHPFLTYYAEETRMYSLAALLSMLTATCFVHAFALRDRRHLVPFAAFGVLLAYTHNWGLFLLAASVAVLALVLWRGEHDRRALLRDAALTYGAMLLLYAPWLPTLVFQAAHTGAPWSDRPSLSSLLTAAFTALGGGAGGPVVALVGGAGVAAALGRSLPVPGGPEQVRGDEGLRRRQATEALLGLAAVALVLAWCASQVSPAWSMRYLAVVVGPAVVLTGVGLAHARRLGIAALVLLALMWANGREGALNGKSNVREVASRIELRPVGPGDLVVSTQPEQVPVLRYYLGDGFRYADATGPVADPRVLDWRDVLDRLRAAHPTPTARRLVDGLNPGQALILVEPILRSSSWEAPWTRLVKRRTIQWERVLERDPRLRRVEVLPRFGLHRPPRGVRAVIYRVR